LLASRKDATVAAHRSTRPIVAGDGRRSPGRFRHSHGPLFMNAGPRLDPAAIETLARLNISGSPDLVTTVVTLFLEAMPAYLATLRQNVGSPDLKALYGASHNLKASSASVGATALASLCAELERLVRSGTTRGTVPLLYGIFGEIEAICPELEALLLSRRDGGRSGSVHAAALAYEEAL
jgi:HPt (histidine-containing phosphotransfer) domain-containing protein